MKLTNCMNLYPNFYYRPNNVLLKDFSAYYLSALHKANQQAAHERCDIRILPTIAWAKQVTIKEFITYTRHETELAISCENLKHHTKIQGVTKLILPNCRAVTKDFNLLECGQTISTFGAMFILPLNGT